jgi:hypothetical protein
VKLVVFPHPIIAHAALQTVDGWKVDVEIAGGERKAAEGRAGTDIHIIGCEDSWPTQHRARTEGKQWESSTHFLLDDREQVAGLQAVLQQIGVAARDVQHRRLVQALVELGRSHIGIEGEDGGKICERVLGKGNPAMTNSCGREVGYHGLRLVRKEWRTGLHNMFNARWAWGTKEVELHHTYTLLNNELVLRAP